MNRHSSTPLAACTIILFAAASSLQPAHAQEAEIVTMIGKQIVKTLGKDAIEFGGEAVAKQTAKRILAEAAETAGTTGSRIARVQIERIVATGKQGLIFDLKAVSGKTLPLLEDVTEEALPSAVRALARPGVSKGIESLGSTALQKVALAGEARLPGAGLKLIQHYGDEGAQLVTKLTEDQANSLIASLRPNAIKALPEIERSKLLNAVTSREDARVFNLEATTGPLVVVASGVLIWHAIDVTFAPNERVTERPDGTVVREKTSVGLRGVETIPLAVRELSGALKWTGITLAVGASLICSFFLWRRQSRARLHRLNTD